MRNFIGTSGFSYAHWKGVFYPEGLAQRKWLEFYSQTFNTVELNSTFYHLPKESTIENWVKRTPKGFTFSVKASKFITHIKRLKDVGENVKLFMKHILLFKDKLGVILFQLPPSMKKDTELLKEFLSLLEQNKRYTIEFRNESWFSKDVYNILEENNVAFCISDTPRYPYAEVITANFSYIRLHGHTELYASNYTEEQLKHYAGLIKKLNKTNIPVYLYFDNDFEGYAVKNALQIIKMLS
jgi:uncharacterized protein YecE (DUF72 family)